MNNRPVDSWTVDEDKKLVHLRHVEQRNFDDIGIALHRSKTSCHAHYCAIVLPKDRVKLFRRSTWTREAEAEVFELRFTKNLKVADIAKITGRNRYSIAEKLERMQNGPRMRLQFRTAKRFIPQAVLDDRNARMASERDISAELCGDPRPGQSALDKQQEPVDQRNKPTLAWVLT